MQWKHDSNCTSPNAITFIIFSVWINDNVKMIYAQKILPILAIVHSMLKHKVLIMQQFWIDYLWECFYI